MNISRNLCWTWLQSKNVQDSLRRSPWESRKNGDKHGIGRIQSICPTCLQQTPILEHLLNPASPLLSPHQVSTLCHLTEALPGGPRHILTPQGHLTLLTDPAMGRLWGIGAGGIHICQRVLGWWWLDVELGWEVCMNPNEVPNTLCSHQRSMSTEQRVTETPTCPRGLCTAAQRPGSADPSGYLHLGHLCETVRQHSPEVVVLLGS